MVGILQEELKAYIPLGSGPDDLLFCTSSGRPLDHSNALRCFHRALEAAGLKRVTIHSLRHSYASTALASGASIKALQRALGRSNASLTLNTYAHFVEKRSRRCSVDMAFRGHKATILDLGRGTARKENMTEGGDGS
jgi:site-specific recombinase XerD